MRKMLIITAVSILAIQNHYTYSQTEFAPIGAQWYYTNTDADPRYSCEKYVSIKDTIIDGKDCKMVLHYNVSPQIDTLFFWQHEEQIYYYFNNDFFLLYDFSVSIGDTITFSFKKSELGKFPFEIIPIDCIVNDTQTISIDGKEMKMILTNIIGEVPGYFHIKNGTYNYIEKIGHPKIFMEEIVETITTSAYTTELRCYHDNEINYVTDWWLQYNLACDYCGKTNVSDIISTNSIQIFPNPTCDFITINTINGDVVNNYQLYDIQGKILREGKLKNESHIIDIRNLNTGVYFIHVTLSNGETKITKILKQ